MRGLESSETAAWFTGTGSVMFHLFLLGCGCDQRSLFKQDPLAPSGGDRGETMREEKSLYVLANAIVLKGSQEM